MQTTAISVVSDIADIDGLEAIHKFMEQQDIAFHCLDMTTSLEMEPGTFADCIVAKQPPILLRHTPLIIYPKVVEKFLNSTPWHIFCCFVVLVSVAMLPVCMWFDRVTRSVVFVLASGMQVIVYGTCVGLYRRRILFEVIKTFDFWYLNGMQAVFVSWMGVWYVSSGIHVGLVVPCLVLFWASHSVFAFGVDASPWSRNVRFSLMLFYLASYIVTLLAARFAEYIYTDKLVYDEFTNVNIDFYVAEMTPRTGVVTSLLTLIVFFAKYALMMRLGLSYVLIWFEAKNTERNVGEVMAVVDEKQKQHMESLMSPPGPTQAAAAPEMKRRATVFAAVDQQQHHHQNNCHLPRQHNHHHNNNSVDNGDNSSMAATTPRTKYITTSERKNAMRRADSRERNTEEQGRSDNNSDNSNFEDALQMEVTQEFHRTEGEENWDEFNASSTSVGSTSKHHQPPATFGSAAHPKGGRAKIDAVDEGLVSATVSPSTSSAHSDKQQQPQPQQTTQRDSDTTSTRMRWRGERTAVKEKRRGVEKEDAPLEQELFVLDDNRTPHSVDVLLNVAEDDQETPLYNDSLVTASEEEGAEGEQQQQQPSDDDEEEESAGLLANNNDPSLPSFFTNAALIHTLRARHQKHDGANPTTTRNGSTKATEQQKHERSTKAERNDENPHQSFVHTSFCSDDGKSAACNGNAAATATNQRQQQQEGARDEHCDDNTSSTTTTTTTTTTSSNDDEDGDHDDTCSSEAMLRSARGRQSTLKFDEQLEHKIEEGNISDSCANLTEHDEVAVANKATPNPKNIGSAISASPSGALRRSVRFEFVFSDVDASLVSRGDSRKSGDDDLSTSTGTDSYKDEEGW